MINLFSKRVMVTGANSMIGRAVCASLERRGAVPIRVLHQSDGTPYSDTQTICDLENKSDVNKLHYWSPEYIIHAAGWNGGIEWNRKYPATIFGKNTRMALNILDEEEAEETLKLLRELGELDAELGKDGW